MTYARTQANANFLWFIGLNAKRMPSNGEVDSPQPKSLLGLVIAAWFGSTRVLHTAPAKTTDTLHAARFKHLTLSGMRLVRCSVI